MNSYDPPPGDNPPPPAGGPPPSGGPPSGPTRLYRSRSERMIAGVCGGLAAYFGVDPTLVRILALATFLIPGSGVIAYLVAWLIVPEEPII
jgi:phage shock protein C